jgi:carbamoyl-phosphate synthase large subunit
LLLSCRLRAADAGYETIMVNCNPETVSTDYDTSDRLYFEPLTAEDVLEILKQGTGKGQLLGVIVQFGGQTPLKLAHALEKAGIPILGTSPDMIDLAEDRDRFQKLLHKLDLKQPKNGIAYSVEQARWWPPRARLSAGGAPLLRARRPRDADHPRRGRGSIPTCSARCRNWCPEDIKARYPNDKTGQINTLLGTNPLLFDTYLTDAIEVDVDCAVRRQDVYVSGIMEHIEEAGIHSGDSACSLPVHTLGEDITAELERQTVALAKALNVGGLMNVQYAIKDGEIYVLEVNPRASRTVPFVAKTIGSADRQDRRARDGGRDARPAISNYGTRRDVNSLDHIAVKEAVFPFSKFPGVDTLLGPEMRSTGEVMGLDHDYAVAFAKAQLGAGAELPKSGAVFISVKDSDKERILPTAKLFVDTGLRRAGHRWHAALSRRQRRAGDQDQQGAGRPAAYRGRDPQPPGAARHQHDGRQEGIRRLQAAAPRRAGQQGALFHDDGPRRSPPSRPETSRCIRCRAISEGRAGDGVRA